MGLLNSPHFAGGEELERLKYNHPGLTVDLGVGLWAWPLPMDYDQDGDLDLIVVCPDKPYSGTYFFENDGQVDTRHAAMPIFKPAVRIADARRNPQLSWVGEEPVVLTPSRRYLAFSKTQWDNSQELPVGTDQIDRSPRLRANQWKLVDWDGDGRQDLLVGFGDWAQYGWDDAFNAEGEWTRGPLEGKVYWLRNEGSDEQPEYAAAVRLQAGESPVNVYGMPSPNAADFDGDGDLDLLCGEFLDGFTYFENVGTRQEPRLAAGRRLASHDQPLAMDLQMITPVACDWDRDGDWDLIAGDEDGRVAWLEHLGRVNDGVPQFAAPRYFQQVADEVKFGALVTPVSVDWDDDGDEDLICGNTAGYIGWIENLDGGNPPRWAAPRYLQSGGQTIRLQAGPRGSIQGPCEAKWGYTTLDVADWDGDGLRDVIVNSIWGKVEWYRNVGQEGAAELEYAGNVRVRWTDAGPPKPSWTWWEPEDSQLATQWRTTPVVVDWNQDGAQDLVMLDHEGYLAWYPRQSTQADAPLLAGRRIFYVSKNAGYDSAHRVKESSGGPLRLNVNRAGGSGRRKLCIVDWDGDGRRDLLVNSQNVNWFRQIDPPANQPAASAHEKSEPRRTWLEEAGPLSERILAGHTTSPTTVDWNGDGQQELLIGAEDGYLYYQPQRLHSSATESR